MSKNIRVILSICICILFFLSSVLSAYAEFSDIGSHWAAKDITRLSEAGLINGNGDGSFKPDSAITRAEFLSIICRLFKYNEKSDSTFPDVATSAWYADAMLKARAAGIIQGDHNGNANPASNISRQEAVVILYRAFDLSAESKNSADKFLDSAQIADWSREAVGAMVENGYIAGKPGNVFGPADNLSRAEAVKIISNIVGSLKNKPGTYSENIEGNLVINSDGVILNDMTVGGSLYITQGVADGEVTLNNVRVKGRTIVRGGGENSIILNNSSLEGTLVIIKQGGKIRIVAKGSTNVPGAELNSGAKLVEDSITGKGFRDVEIMEMAPGQEIKLDGDFENVEVEAPGVKIEVMDGSVGKLEVGEKASDMDIKLTSGTIGQLEINTRAGIDISAGTVDTVNINAGAAGTRLSIDKNAGVETLNANAGADIKGTGNIANANIAADGVKIEQTPGKINIAEGKTAVIGGKEVKGSTAAGGGGGGPGNGGDSGDHDNPGSLEPIPLAIVNTNLTVAVGEYVYAGASSTVSGTSIVLQSSNPGIAVADSVNGTITGIAAGTATITVTASSSGYANTTAQINVTVKPRTAAGQLSVVTKTVTKNTSRDILLYYKPASPTANGQVTFLLPEHFEAANGDLISLSGQSSIAISGSETSSAGKTIVVSDNGRKVTVSNVNNEYIWLVLKEHEIPAPGVFTFSASYDSDGSESAILPSSGEGIESGTLQVVDYVTILACYQIISENSIVYMEWTTPEEADNVLLQYRIKGGQSWVDLVNGQDYETGGVEGKPATWALVKGLSPDATYEFKVVVTGGDNEGESDIMFCEIKDYSEDSDNVNFAYATDRVAIADNKYIIDLINKSGFNSFTTADSVYADPGNVITYTVNADGKIQITGIPEANDGGNTILDVNSINIKVHGNCYYFIDSTIIVYDEGGGGGSDIRELTKNDLYKEMIVEIYLRKNNDIAVLVVTLM